jgi:hypothetical protein
MTCFAITWGAGLLGWLVPEFLLILSPRPEGFKAIPLGMNVASAVAFGLIAYGVSA